MRRAVAIAAGVVAFQNNFKKLFNNSLCSYMDSVLHFESAMNSTLITFINYTFSKKKRRKLSWQCSFWLNITLVRREWTGSNFSASALTHFLCSRFSRRLRVTERERKRMCMSVFQTTRASERERSKETKILRMRYIVW